MESQFIVSVFLRVSTSEQETENQKHGISEYIKSAGLPEAVFFEETASGSRDWKTSILKRIIDASSDGDVLVVSEISRLARSTLQVLEILKACADHGIIVHIVKSRMIMDGSIQAKIVSTVFGLLAELERDLIQARTKESLDRRRESGLPMGRPAGEAKTLRLDGIASDLDKWRALGLGWAAIAKLAGCARSTLYAWAARRRPDWKKSIQD